MRLLSLDVLRGIAVLLVIVRHTDATSGDWLAPVRRGGWVGVDIFFVLSGFLVSGLLFREFEQTGQIKPLRFLIRRGWKIYPAFWVFITATVLYCGLDLRALSELTFAQSYSGNRLWGHTWSLAIEEHFYLLLPFALIPLTRSRFAELPRIVFMVMAGLLVARCINGLRPFDAQKHVFPTHLRLDGMFFGVLLSYWYRSWPEFQAWCRDHARMLIWSGMALLSPVFLFDLETTPALYTIGFTGNMLGSGAILMGMVAGGVPETAWTRVVGWIGVYSYSIYLWHAVAIGVFPTWPLIPLAATCIGLGVVMAKLVEVPCLRLREAVSPLSLSSPTTPRAS